jgi:uncharacterized protein HemX
MWCTTVSETPSAISSAETGLPAHRVQVPDKQMLLLLLLLLLLLAVGAAVCVFLQVLAQLCDLLHSQRV